MKLTKYIGIMAVAAGMLSTATSCSDDWNPLSQESTVTTSASNTLWQNIVLAPQLSQFANLAQKAGFADALNTSNYYTVWAPLNDSPDFDYEGLMKMDSAYVRKTFIKNLIAPFGHELRPNATERVTMLNDKIYTFTSVNNTFGDVEMTQTNLPNSNGLLHIINGNSIYRDNLYEALEGISGCDSVCKYFRSKDQVTLDTKNSVVGPIVNGKQTYLDSVLIYSNRHLSSVLRVDLEAEDSSYTFLAPTNDAWNKLYATISPSYNFVQNTKYQDLSQSRALDLAPTGTDEKLYPVATNNLAVLTQLKDSLTKRAFTDYLFFNNNNRYNSYLKDSTIAVTASDTLYTTRGKKLSNAMEILSSANQVGSTIHQSNGYIRKVNDLPLRSWETYLTKLSFSPRTNTGRTLSCTQEHTTIYKENLDPAIGELDSVTTSFTYYHYTQSTIVSQPEIDLYMPGVMGTQYEIYLITVPPCIEEGVTDKRQLILNATVNYCDKDNNLNEIFLPSGNKASYASGERLKGANPLTDSIRVNMERMDTLDLGSITFPVSYDGIKAYPNIKIWNAIQFVQDATGLSKIYCPDIRIVGVILKPVALVEYEKSQKK